MAIQTTEEWYSEIFYDDSTCAIVNLKLSNGDTYKFGVAVLTEDYECWGESNLEHRAGSYISDRYSDWHSLDKEYETEIVPHSDFLKAVGKRADTVGGSVNADGGVYIISSNNAEKEAEANVRKFIDQYELDHEDDIELD